MYHQDADLRSSNHQRSQTPPNSRKEKWGSHIPFEEEVEMRLVRNQQRHFLSACILNSRVPKSLEKSMKLNDYTGREILMNMCNMLMIAWITTTSMRLPSAISLYYHWPNQLISSSNIFLTRASIHGMICVRTSLLTSRFKKGNIWWYPSSVGLHRRTRRACNYTSSASYKWSWKWEALTRASNARFF